MRQRRRRCRNQRRWATDAAPTHAQHHGRSHARGCGRRRSNPRPAPRAVVGVRVPLRPIQLTPSTTSARIRGVAPSAAQPRPSTTGLRTTVDAADRSARPASPRQHARITGGSGTTVSTATAQRSAFSRAAIEIGTSVSTNLASKIATILLGAQRRRLECVVGLRYRSSNALRMIPIRVLVYNLSYHHSPC